MSISNSFLEHAAVIKEPIKFYAFYECNYSENKFAEWVSCNEVRESGAKFCAACGNHRLMLENDDAHIIGNTEMKTFGHGLGLGLVTTAQSQGQKSKSKTKAKATKLKAKVKKIWPRGRGQG